jgi:hypothetical protein
MMKPVPSCCSIAVLTVAACATQQVRGSIDGPTGTETFVGTAHGSVVDKSGNMTFTTNTGVVCSGRFVYLTVEAARGIFDCGNGQGGPFDLTRAGDRWVGTGIVGNRRVAIELGHL